MYSLVNFHSDILQQKLWDLSSNSINSGSRFDISSTINSTHEGGEIV